MEFDLFVDVEVHPAVDPLGKTYLFNLTRVIISCRCGIKWNLWDLRVIYIVHHVQGTISDICFFGRDFMVITLCETFTMWSLPVENPEKSSSLTIWTRGWLWICLQHIATKAGGNMGNRLLTNGWTFAEMGFKRFIDTDSKGYASFFVLVSILDNKDRDYRLIQQRRCLIPVASTILSIPFQDHARV